VVSVSTIYPTMLQKVKYQKLLKNCLYIYIIGYCFTVKTKHYFKYHF